MLSGRQTPEKTDETVDMKADMVIKALGFDPEDLPVLFDEQALRVNRWGAIQVDYKTMETSLPGVYAAGDIVRGAFAGGLGDCRRSGGCRTHAQSDERGGQTAPSGCGVADAPRPQTNKDELRCLISFATIPKTVSV